MAVHPRKEKERMILVAIHPRKKSELHPYENFIYTNLLKYATSILIKIISSGAKKSVKISVMTEKEY